MIHWGFETLEKLLPANLWSSIHTAYCNPATVSEGEVDGITFFNGHTGELLFQSPSAVMRRVTRQKFRRLLCTDLSICWGKMVESLQLGERPETGVTIKFKDGSQEVADLVVGADGPRSTIRHILLGSDKASGVQSDFVCGYASTVLSRETAEMVLAAHPVWAMAYHSMGVCALGGDSINSGDYCLFAR